MNATHVQITFRDGRVLHEVHTPHAAWKLTTTYNRTAYDAHIIDAVVEWDDDAWMATAPLDEVERATTCDHDPARIEPFLRSLRQHIGEPTARDDKWQPVVSASELRQLLDELDEVTKRAEKAERQVAAVAAVVADYELVARLNPEAWKRYLNVAMDLRAAVANATAVTEACVTDA